MHMGGSIHDKQCTCEPTGLVQMVGLSARRTSFDLGVNHEFPRGVGRLYVNSIINAR